MATTELKKYLKKVNGYATTKHHTGGDYEFAKSLLKEYQFVTVVGDYDCDGACSVAICKIIKPHWNFVIPNRMIEGYGISKSVVDRIANSDFNTELVLTVDNGVVAEEALGYANNEYGYECIVTDHHLSDTKPSFPTINPNCKGVEHEEHKNFCGASVVADLLFSVFGSEKFYEVIPWLTVATIADMVKIDKLNYWRVKTGLEYLRHDRTCQSFAALCEVLEIDQSKLTTDDIGFLIGPTINAVGRLDDMSYGVNAILDINKTTAIAKWKKLKAINKERKEKTKEAEELAEKDMNIIINDNVIVVQADIHPGIIGIVASRLKEKYNKPAIVFNMEGKASCRSVEGFHMRDALVQCDKYLLKYGGHSMAAGLTIK